MFRNVLHFKAQGGQLTYRRILHTRHIQYILDIFARNDRLIMYNYWLPCQQDKGSQGKKRVLTLYAVREAQGYGLEPFLMEFLVLLGQGAFHALSGIKPITPRYGRFVVRSLGHWRSQGTVTRLIRSWLQSTVASVLDEYVDQTKVLKLCCSEIVSKIGLKGKKLNPLIN